MCIHTHTTDLARNKKAHRNIFCQDVQDLTLPGLDPKGNIPFPGIFKFPGITLEEKNEEESSQNYLKIPASGLNGFINLKSYEDITKKGKSVIFFQGKIDNNENIPVCPHCGSKLHRDGSYLIYLQHLWFGQKSSKLEIERERYYCPQCKKLTTQAIPFKSEEHRLTLQLEQSIKDMLQKNVFTIKEISTITGVCRNIIKDIDKKRLLSEYTEESENGQTLKKPERYARFLGIDEFLLHKGHKYATIIIDLESGHILWIAHGKKKQVVYDFLDHVGEEWMSNVEAVACDMNSDFQEAFEERCKRVKIVFDRFHIIKNFNDKVVSQVRKDEQARLKAEGDLAGANTLKKSRFILTSNRSTLQRKDQEARDGVQIKSGSTLFNIPSVTRKEGYEARYDELIKQNKLLFTTDLVKEKLAFAYSLTDENQMRECILEIVNICDASENKHLKWFSKLLTNHIDGIVSHAKYAISSGKIEGINNRIKTVRRAAYGFRDDEYFFLKLMDMSRNSPQK